MALRSQISPHFIFNCLNSMQQYVVDNDIEGSNRFITNFSKLVRKTLDFSDKNEISIKEELDYLETYLKLEQERFENKFQFKITTQSGFKTEDYYLPPLLLQPIVENAVRHGVRARKDRNGLITVNVQANHSHMIISIADNGPGIEHSRKLKHETSDHTSMGVRLVRDRIKVWNDTRNGKILMHAQEVSNDEINHGTLVTISIPLLCEHLS